MEKNSRLEKAMEILRLGIKYLSDYALFRVQMGDYYLRRDIPYRAQEEYMQVLGLDLDNRSILLRLEKMRSL